VPRFESLLNRRPSAVKKFCGLLFGAIGAFGAVVYQEMHKPPEKDSIVFGYKIDPTNRDYLCAHSSSIRAVPARAASAYPSRSAA
jgi:hypothetical protein